MIRSRVAFAALLLIALAQTPQFGVTATAQQPAAAVDPSYLDLLRWRSVGPSRGGRVVAVSGDPVNKFTFYQGTTGGGVWKTEDGGINWANVSDGFFKSGSVGAIAVAPSSPNVVYVGQLTRSLTACPIRAPWWAQGRGVRAGRVQGASARSSSDGDPRQRQARGAGRC